MGDWLRPQAVSALLASAIMLTLCPPRAEARAPANAAGAEEIVFLHGRDACRPEDIPDEPARAFRDAGGRVHLFASHYVNFGSVGPDLNSVKRDCRLSFQGADSDDPARFDDREWLTSFWTEDGKTVHALVHNEFQANLRPALCPTGRYFDCWYNAIIAAVSTDGGYHFSRQRPALVAAPARRFDPSIGHPVGYFNPSNIVKRDGYYYVMVFAEVAGTQQRGNCLLRTDDLARADSWRAWDGAGFTIALASPYEAAAGQACAPVAPRRLTQHVWSLVLARPSGRYLAVMARERGDRAVLISESADLLEWSEPAPVLESPAAAQRCDDHTPWAYPSLIDPASPSRNFETVGRTAYLYFTRLHAGPQCQGTLNRDLVRIPFSIAPAD